MIVRYFISIDARWEAHAEFALQLLLEGIGVKGKRVRHIDSADLYYSADKLQHQSLVSPIWIRATEVSSWDYASPGLVWINEIPVLYQGPKPDELGTHGALAADLVYSTYAVVTGVLERAEERDAWGVPVALGGFLKTSALLETPVIALYCKRLTALLADLFESRDKTPLQVTPLWPNEKKCAAVISHDVDGPFYRPALGFHAKHLKQYLKRRDLNGLKSGSRSLMKTMALTLLGRIPAATEDPNFGFEAWMRAEGQMSATSCFYVAVTSSADDEGHLVDVSYDFRHPAMVDALNLAISKGWEIGLHASVNAQHSARQFQKEKALLESVLNGYKVRGLRHHYWAMNCENPEGTLWKQADAGFEYDSSLGMNDSPGYRRGMVWPYNPFDRDRKTLTSVLEIPPTLMDGGVYYHNVQEEEGKALVRAHLKRTFQAGGAAVLDWHVEQMNPARLRGAGPALMSVLTELRDDQGVFWASPAQLADWWIQRRHQMEAQVQEQAAD